jgi:hypothetical protein
MMRCLGDQAYPGYMLQLSPLGFPPTWDSEEASVPQNNKKFLQGSDVLAVRQPAEDRETSD